MSDMEWADLTGDPCYDHLKSCIDETYELLGGAILVPKVFSASKTRKRIVMRVKHIPTGQIKLIEYNYNRLKRMYVDDKREEGRDEP